MSTPEINTLLKLLSVKGRLDGRSLNEYREITFRFPQVGANMNRSSCIASVGATSVMATVSVEVVEPKHFRPSQGTLFVNFDTGLVNVNASAVRRQILEDEGRRLSTVLQTLLRDSVDLDALCIVAWERVFAIRVELRTLSYDGNLGDCGALAALLSLATFRRPDIFVEEDGNVIVDYEAKHRPRVSLGLRRFPVLVTFGLAEDMDLVVQDACAREEEFLTGGRIMVGVTVPNEICCLYTCGLTKPVESERLRKCVRTALSTAASLTALVRRVLESVEHHRSTTQRAKTMDMLSNGPTSLVISSSSFINIQEEVPSFKSPEVPAEIALPSDVDMVCTDESKPAHADLYGVIEVSSLYPQDTESDIHGVHIKELEGQLEVAGLSAGYLT